jgi:hypothetical protein
VIVEEGARIFVRVAADFDSIDSKAEYDETDEDLSDGHFDWKKRGSNRGMMAEDDNGDLQHPEKAEDGNQQK